MNLDQMQSYLMGIFNQYSYNPRGGNVGPLHVNQVPVQCIFNASIEISFPGYKSFSGRHDYLVKLNQNGNLWNVSHDDIMDEIYATVSQNPALGTIVESLLSDISHNWENINLNNYSSLSFPNLSLDEFVECICYISVQEEINYPTVKGYDGYKRPFYSYLEAVYSAYSNPIVSFSIAKSRCNSNYRFNPIEGIPYNII